MRHSNRFKFTLVLLFSVSVFSTMAQDYSWYIPTDLEPVNSPAIFAPEGQEWPGYVISQDQECAQEIIDYDEFCSTTNWDDTCQERYNECAYEINCQPIDQDWGDWYIPNEGSSGPAIYTCEAPAGYFLADQDCAQFVINHDPFCVNTAWDSVCVNAYNCCLGVEGCGDSAACNYSPELCDNNDLCEYPQIYIPVDPNTGPAIITCNRPNDYVLADLECAQFIMALNPEWFQTSWSAYHYQYVCCVNAGCMDENACNYDENACPSQFGVCVYGGCTYEGAENYDSAAACDDGSCVFPNEGIQFMGDLNGDFTVTSADLSLFLSAFGTSYQ